MLGKLGDDGAEDGHRLFRCLEHAGHMHRVGAAHAHGVVLTSELVTNAIRHGACREDGDLIELVLWPADGHYWLAVSDPGTGKPAPAHPDPESEGGRGLLLVDRLATAWTVRARPTRGTSVIAGLSCP